MHEHDSMHEHGNHLHYHPTTENVDKAKVLDRISSPDNFKGFDDFMYFAYKNWLVFQDNNEDTTKVKDAFVEVCKKFKKFKDNENIDNHADQFVDNLTKVTDLMLNHNLHEATSLVEKFVKPFTLQEKFIRNFNKRINEA